MGTVHKFRPRDTVAFEGDAASDIRSLTERLVREACVLRELGDDPNHPVFLRFHSAHERLQQQCLAMQNAMLAIERYQDLLAEHTQIGIEFEMTSANDVGSFEAVLTCCRRGAIVYISKFWFFEVKSSFEECVAILKRRQN